jgi:hypothetical protein
MNRTVRVLLLITVAGLFPRTIASRSEGTKSDWAPLEFLLGDWVGEGGGQPGQGAGEFSFHPGLQDRILVRKSYAAYPPTKDHPASQHEDLTVVYKESDSAPLRAIYFDNEGHVINYSINISPDRKTIEFVSDVLPSSPRFRLTYVKTGSDTLTLRFEIAAPGKPDSFSTYIEAKAKRK